MAKKNRLKKLLVEQILDRAGIPYQQISFQNDQLLLDVDQTRIYKTLVLRGDKTGPVIGVVPLTAHLSEKKLAAISGNKKVSMIPKKELVQTTGYIHGANTPVGIRHRTPYPIYLDQTALGVRDIIVSAGEVGRSIQIDSQLLANFVGATFAAILEDNSSIDSC